MAPGVRFIDSEILATGVFFRECFLSALTSAPVHGRHLAGDPFVIRTIEKCS
jgi:hypothetical protein